MKGYKCMVSARVLVLDVCLLEEGCVCIKRQTVSVCTCVWRGGGGGSGVCLCEGVTV